MMAMILLAWSADGATPVKKKAPVKKGISKAASSGKNKSTGAARSTTASTAGSKRGKKAPVKRATTWRNRQLTPSTDRYREIQQALAGKGYLKSEDATGNWNAASVDALKKFQAGQNLDASGKINSLSLIALGLGPKREPLAVAAPAKAPPEADHTDH
jgi:hypothetical protein